MGGSGKGGNNRRRSFKRRDKESENWQASPPRQGKKPANVLRDNQAPRYDKNRGALIDRPKWSPPKMSTEPIPSPDCPYCGKPIRDLALALTDKISGTAVHFDCVIERIGENEILDKGDTVTYIGGGRFGVVHFSNPQDTRNFRIKKILEWEDKENRAGWRNDISDHYSLT